MYLIRHDNSMLITMSAIPNLPQTAPRSYVRLPTVVPHPEDRARSII